MVYSYMGWTRIPDIDSAASSTVDNPFAVPKQQPVGKIIINLPTDEDTCPEVQEIGGLQRDQFVKPAKSHAKWDGLHPNQDRPAVSVSYWHFDSDKLNSAYSRIARSSLLTTPAWTSRTISQDTLRKWVKAARESTYVCNLVAGLSRCLSKVQQGMQSQLQVLQSEQTRLRKISVSLKIKTGLTLRLLVTGQSFPPL